MACIDSVLFAATAIRLRPGQRGKREAGIIQKREQSDAAQLLILPAIKQKSEEQKIETIMQVSSPGASETEGLASSLVVV